MTWNVLQNDEAGGLGVYYPPSVLVLGPEV